MVIMTDIQKRLFKLSDPHYKEFNSKLIPNVDKNTMMGIRIPVLRKLAKEFAKEPESKNFLKELPHKYFEENNLHAFIIQQIKDYDKAMEETERFLPYVDNWATCDTFLPKVFSRYTEKAYEKIELWVKSDRAFTVRFAIGMLMSNYLDENFLPEQPKLVAGIKSEEYYVNMMIAWYFATALAKQPAVIMPFIQEKRLSPFVHNKTIQKCVESYRIPINTKEYLKTLKIKSI